MQNKQVMEQAAAARRNASLKQEVQALKAAASSPRTLQQRSEFLVAQHAYMSAVQSQYDVYLMQLGEHRMRQAEADAAARELDRCVEQLHRKLHADYSCIMAGLFARPVCVCCMSVSR